MTLVKSAQPIGAIFFNIHSENNGKVSSEIEDLSPDEKKSRSDLRVALIKERPNSAALNWEKIQIN